jgi:hypothetical protein
MVDLDRNKKIPPPRLQAEDTTAKAWQEAISRRHPCNLRCGFGERLVGRPRHIAEWITSFICMTAGPSRRACRPKYHLPSQLSPAIS